ncbi:MAG: SIS domain-containing protein [Rhodoglobus sp.]|uniref:SIS domain-containing protein n=1 Tax=Salinibacterium sp. G-O1 TaxID=3046208 RepID=UPI0024BA756A|nr:SIS domain-containing protein [Salinibacterium sp. G-O1]MDJ0334556.1 SIS domain-containing protein [Salinibacterium sp. G-O1]
MTHNSHEPIADPAAGHHMEEELRSQPDVWAQAVENIDRSALPDAGTRVAIVGCGTSWFMAQSYATLREQSGQGETDAFTASEAFPARDYDAVIALSRSGTTTEVLQLVSGLRDDVRTIGIVAEESTPLGSAVGDVIALPFADEQSVVQTRFATTALAVLRASLGEDLAPVIAQARDAVGSALDEALLSAEQYTFLGTGFSVGLAHEAALKMREASQSWTESYPAKEYRHGPISIASEGRVVWMFGTPPTGLAKDIAVTGAHFENGGGDPMVDLIRAQRVALERARRAGLNPDKPRNLSRAVILDQ